MSFSNLTIHPLLAIVFALMLSACVGNSLEDYKEEGEEITAELIRELHCIKNYKDLNEHKDSLRKKFTALAKLAVEARAYQQEHPELERPIITTKNKQLNERLRRSLNRIYKIEGGREIIEKCEEEGLAILDYYEKNERKVIF